MEETDLNYNDQLILIGGSAGSLSVIIAILQQLEHKRCAIVIVLHRKESAEPMLAALLSSRSNFHVKEADEKERIIPGNVYLAPANYHLLIETDYTLSLDASEKINYSRPSIDVTFESAAIACQKNIIAILLSGGNNDGAEGMKKVKERGGVTIVQDPLTAEVAMMPECSLANSKPDFVLSPDAIIRFLNNV